MHLDLDLALAGLVIGFLVGFTGMGGGALLTPLLVLFFRIAPLAAISSDLLTSLIIKPVGAAVHMRYRTVNWRLVRWLTVGSVPAAFAGAVIIGSIGHAPGAQVDLKLAIGIALCATVGMTLLRQVLDRHTDRRDDHDDRPSIVRPLRTAAIGMISGFAVGMTSVGAGSLVIALLLIAYPQLRPAQLVGTDILQAIPLVAAAAVGHLLYGDVHLAITTSLLLGGLPGVYLGARLSAQGPGAVIKPVIAATLLASALALLNVATPLVIGGSVAGLVMMVLLQMQRPAQRWGSGCVAVNIDLSEGQLVEGDRRVGTVARRARGPLRRDRRRRARA
jgi:uncharacterized membrane protein YfcA